MSRMQALRLNYLESKLYLTEITKPEITNPRQVIVKMKYAAICINDQTLISGDWNFQTQPNLTLGHEGVGIVDEIGENVVSLSIGDKVVLNPTDGCQVCDLCGIGKPQLCQTAGLKSGIGLNRDGTWAQYLICLEHSLIKIPNDISLENAIFAQPLSVVLYAWDRFEPIFVGEKILIFGANFFTMLWMILFHKRGFKDVTILDNVENKRESLKKLETGFKIISYEEFQNETIDISFNNGFDMIVDCNGFPNDFENSLQLLKCGGKLCVFAGTSHGSKINLEPYEFIRKELTVLGVFSNTFCLPKALNYIKILGKRYINYDVLNVKTYDLSEYETAFDNLEQGLVSKCIFTF